MVWWFGGSQRLADAIRQIDENSDRALAIIAAAILEEHLTETIKRRWVNSPATSKRMLSVEGPVGQFGPKIDLVYLMGLISADGHQDMKVIKKIRNTFAHDLEVDTFETSKIKSWCFDLKHFEKFVTTAAEFRGHGPQAKKLFPVQDKILETTKGRYITAVQVYSAIFAGAHSPHIPPPNLPSPFY